MARLCFLDAVERNPRMLCGCHSVAFMSSCIVAPLVRAISSSTLAPLLPERGPESFLALGSRLGLASFLGLEPLAGFRPLGAPFLGVACFFDRVLAGASC